MLNYLIVDCLKILNMFYLIEGVFDLENFKSILSYLFTIIKILMESFRRLKLQSVFSLFMKITNLS